MQRSQGSFDVFKVKSAIMNTGRVYFELSLQHNGIGVIITV